LLATNLNREETTPALVRLKPHGARESAKKDWECEGKPFAGFKNLRGLPFFAVKK